MANYSKLSRVEKLVMRGASYGLTPEQIARGLGLSQEAVGREIADAYNKVYLNEQRHKKAAKQGVSLLVPV